MKKVKKFAQKRKGSKLGFESKVPT